MTDYTEILLAVGFKDLSKLLNFKEIEQLKRFNQLDLRYKRDYMLKLDSTQRRNISVYFGRFTQLQHHIEYEARNIIKHVKDDIKIMDDIEKLLNDIKVME